MFDQTSEYITSDNVIISDATPIRYSSNGTSLGFCVDDWEWTNGQILLSNSLMLGQQSCKPNIGNAGNWYNWPTTTAGGSKTSGDENNSICPNGWQLTVTATSNRRSWYYLIKTTYNIQDSNDSKIRPLPLSFIRSGGYGQGLLNNRAYNGSYWSSTAGNSIGAYGLGFQFDYLNPQYNYGDYYNKYYGRSVRCVSR